MPFAQEIISPNAIEEHYLVRINDSEIPKSAAEVVKSTFADGTRRIADYHLDGERVGYRTWYEDGQLEYELTLRGGRRHGPEREWFENGQLQWETGWANGAEHGLARQWDEHGELVCTYEMDHGTGMDIWVVIDFDTGEYVLAEERYQRDTYLDGYERWWNWDGTTVSHEVFYKMGEQHGIWREWNRAGRLSRGFPKYFIDGRQVTKRQYLAACRHDPTLPHFTLQDNAPQRQISEPIRKRLRPKVGHS